MISLNAKTIQKSFTEQAKNFETKSMNFTKQEYLEHMISCVKPQKTDTVLEVAAFLLARKSYDALFRGSDNQRLIDVGKSLEIGRVVLWERADPLAHFTRPES